MPMEFTPAALRALEAAARWSSGDELALDVPELLLGLVLEPECRAAVLLRERGVDPVAVRGRWSGLQEVSIARPAGRYSAALDDCLAEIPAHLGHHPRPLQVATEHLLLGLVAGRHEASSWLREQGLVAAELVLRIDRLYDYSSQPLELESIGEGVAPHAEGRAAGAPAASPSDSTVGDTAGALRAVDAAANRAHEGLRVVEDYVRFALDDAHLTAVTKQLRHDLADALRKFPETIACRATEADVGTQISTSAEGIRADLSAVVTANLRRVQESLRSLEEFAKLLVPAAAGQMEQLRYRAYTLHRAVHVCGASRQRLEGARLYVLIDGGVDGSQFAGTVAALVEAGVHVLQLRDKELDDVALMERARTARRLTAESDTLLIVNDRPDLAVLCGADGVHVGQTELTVHDVRRVVGPEMLIGVSTHTIDQARAAVLAGADYLGVGPVFSSPTKQFDALAGLAFVEQAAAEIRLPAFAIGGITLENAPQVFAAGLHRFAVSSAVARAEDPAAAAAGFLHLLGQRAI